MIKAVIFDLDGTLLDTLDDLAAAINHALSALGYAPLDRADVRRFVGNGVVKLVERALTAVGGNACDIEKCLDEFKAYYGAHGTDNTRPYDGVTELLAELKERGMKTAVVTNKYDEAAQRLKLKFYPEVDVAVGTRDGIRPKPAPDGVAAAMRELGVEAADCVYVGDGETDICTAKAVRMPVAAALWGFRDREELVAFDPDAVIESPSDLVPALERMGLL